MSLNELQKNRFDEILGHYESILKLDSSPVAVKLLKEPIELEELEGRELDKHLARSSLRHKIQF